MSRSLEHQEGIFRRSLALLREEMSCIGCKFLNLSEESKEHIIGKHYLIPANKHISSKESFFFSNVLHPIEMFNVLQLTPRFQLKQRGWSGTRFVYFMKFDIDIGVFPVPGSTTDKLDIICYCKRCPVCFVHAPTEVVTVYPASGAELM